MFTGIATNYGIIKSIKENTSNEYTIESDIDLSKVKNDDDWANLSDEEVSRPLKPYYLPGNL